VNARRLFLLGCVSTFLSCRRRKAEGFPGYAFVANLEGRAVAVVDLGAFTVARYIRLDGSPSEVISDPVRPAVYALTPGAGTVHEISAGDLTLHRQARCAASALSMRLAPDGSSLWVLCAETRELIRLPIDGFRAATRISLPARPADLDISPGGRQAAVSFAEEGAVGFVNLDAGRTERVVDVGASSGTLRYRKDGRLLLVANPAERMLSILDAETGGLVVRLPLAVEPRHFCFKPDGGQLFITGAGMDAVVTVYPYQTQVGSTTLAGRAPGFVAASAAPDYLFVANPASDDVTILDIRTQRVVAVVTVGKQPSYITITPDNQYALVLNRQSGDMAVIRIASLTGRRRKSAPLFTMIPIGSKPVSAVVRAV
jgi:YVTN family beta-propeller protein